MGKYQNKNIEKVDYQEKNLIIFLLNIFFIIILFLLSFSIYYFNALSIISKEIKIGLTFLILTFFVFLSFFVKKTYYILLYIIILYSFQNFYIGVLNYCFPISYATVKWLLMLKDISVIFIFILIMLLSIDQILIKIKKIFLLFYIIIILITLYFIFNKLDLIAALGYTRNFVLPITFFYLGYICTKFNNIKQFLENFLIIYSFIMIISFYELLVNPNLWNFLGGRIINISRGFGDVAILQTVIMDKVFNRIGGTFLDSVNFGYFLAISIVIFISFKEWVNKYIRLLLSFLILLTFIILFFTFAKGGWLILFFSLIGYSILKYKKSFTSYLFFFLFSIIIFILMIPIVIKIFPTTIYHFAGLINSISNITILGHGLGSGGNFLKGLAGVASHEKWMASSESGFGTMLYQMGIIFTTLYYGTFIFLLYILNRGMQCLVNLSGCCYRYIKTIKMQIFLLLSWILVSVFQENAFSPAANFLLFLFLGATYKFVKEEYNANIR